MPDETPTGPLAVAVDALRTLLANCPQFQAWTGTANAAAALLRIFTGEIGFPIVAVAIAGGVVTVSTREPHGLTAGQTVTLEGKSIGSQSDAAIAGSRTILATPSATSLTFATALGDLDAVEPEVAIVLPCARPLAVIVEADDALSSEIVGTGGAGIFAGGLEILLEGATSTAYHNDPANALAEARNAVGLLVQDLAYTAGTADLMVLNDVKIGSGPRFVSLPEQDAAAYRFERWQALLAVTWGVRS